MKREVCGLGPGGYKMVEEIFSTDNYILVRDDSGREHICKQGLGHWLVMSPTDLMHEMESLRKAAKAAAEVQS